MQILGVLAVLLFGFVLGLVAGLSFSGWWEENNI